MVRYDSRILRAIARDKADHYKSLLRETWIKDLIADGSLPTTVETAAPPLKYAERWAWLEHGVVAFPCYPHEITALQLHDSALLTLKIAIKAAQYGWALKDASAWNVLHSRGRPVFVDLLSFERLGSTGTWIAYGQFVRHFIVPLLLYRTLGITPPQVFLLERDGITPEHAYRLLRGWNRLSATALEYVVLPRLLSPAGERLIGERRRTHRVRTFKPDMAQELVVSRLRRIERRINRLRPEWNKAKSTWVRYEEERNHYSANDLDAKTEFVRQNLAEASCVLDLGCNAGEFSLMAAKSGKTAVAADFDHEALSRLYGRIRAGTVPVSPLMLSIGRPTPAIGWENREIPSFLERAAGQFDCVLVLGLVHHLLVSERATLPMLADLLVRIAPRTVILEWVDPTDPKFRQLAGFNQKLYSHLDETALEAALEPGFVLQSKLRLPSGTRLMYLWSKRDELDGRNHAQFEV